MPPCDAIKPGAGLEAPPKPRAGSADPDGTRRVVTEPAPTGPILQWPSRSAPIGPGPHFGRVKRVRPGIDGFTLEGWIEGLPDAAAPPTLLLVRDGVVRAEGRAQPASAPGQRYEFSIWVSLEVVSPPLVFDFTVYALDVSGTAVRLAAEGQAACVLGLALRTVHDFYRLIQTPSTRIADPELLLYASIWAFDRFRDDYPLHAGALCVLGYRLLDGLGGDTVLATLFEAQKNRLLELTPTLPKGLFLRWHTSIRLIAGYLAYQRGDTAEAIGHFERISRFAGDLPQWPTAMTNVLLGGFIAGYLYWEQGDMARAIACWSAAPEVLRLGASQAPLQNFYAYGELENAIRVAQECFVARQVAETGGPLTNPALGPVGRGILLDQLPSPIGRLVAQRQHVG